MAQNSPRRFLLMGSSPPSSSQVRLDTGVECVTSSAIFFKLWQYFDGSYFMMLPESRNETEALGFRKTHQCGEAQGALYDLKQVTYSACPPFPIKHDEHFTR